MNWREGVRLAFVQIRAQKLKSFFAVIGVIIGVMFLMTVVSIVEGMNTYIEQDLATAIFGVNTVTVSRTPEVQFSGDPDEWRAQQRRPLLTFADAEAIRAGLTVDAVVGVASGGGGRLLAESGTEIENVRVIGASAEVFRIRSYDIERGRAFNALEDRLGEPVIVLGSEAAAELFGPLDPLGRTVRVNRVPFRVIGVLEEQGSLFGMSMDNMAIAPAHSPMKRFVSPRNSVDDILVRTNREEDLERAMVDIEAVMRVRHRLRPAEPNDFAIETAEETLEFWGRISRMLLIAFPGLVAIALVVGGIVIMNIMLVSVVERTREIGIRKAVGARRRDIHLQVLVEAAALSATGAAIGVGIGIGLAQIVRAVSPLPASVAPLWIFVSVGVATGVGILAGIYPAARAARFDPVVALRAE
jgi:putative ABC transport system permease protein